MKNVNWFRSLRLQIIQVYCEIDIVIIKIYNNNDNKRSQISYKGFKISTDSHKSLLTCG